MFEVFERRLRFVLEFACCLFWNLSAYLSVAFEVYFSTIKSVGFGSCFPFAFVELKELAMQWLTLANFWESVCLKKMMGLSNVWVVFGNSSLVFLGCIWVFFRFGVEQLG